ncbi:hypothetical protein G9A89_001313 [Geosiphon pyriformis]|nr:hypothetical protein G9A89_001313 [Geosiphon pyriformis]
MNTIWKLKTKEAITKLLAKYQPLLKNLPKPFLPLEKLLEPPAFEVKIIPNDFVLYRIDLNAQIRKVSPKIYQDDVSDIAKQNWTKASPGLKGLFKILANILVLATQEVRESLEVSREFSDPGVSEFQEKSSDNLFDSARSLQESTRIPIMFVNPTPIINEIKLRQNVEKGQLCVIRGFRSAKKNSSQFSKISPSKSKKFRFKPYLREGPAFSRSLKLKNSTSKIESLPFQKLNTAFKDIPKNTSINLVDHDSFDFLNKFPLENAALIEQTELSFDSYLNWSILDFGPIKFSTSTILDSSLDENFSIFPDETLPFSLVPQFDPKFFDFSNINMKF